MLGGTAERGAQPHAARGRRRGATTPEMWPLGQRVISSINLVSYGIAARGRDAVSNSDSSARPLKTSSPSLGVPRCDRELLFIGLSFYH